MKKCFLGFVIFLLTSTVYAQLTPISVDIPMRDGKFLAADFYTNDSTIEKPTILIMTPYNKFYYKLSGLPFGIKYDLTKSEYNFVIVDWRGRFASASAFALNSSNGEDGYDVVEWIAAQNWSTGKIGTWGPSALGNIQFSIAKEQPPHLTCCVPEVASPIFEYTKYFPGGVLETATFKTLNEKLFAGSYNLVVQNPHYNLLWQIAEANSTYPDKIKVPMLLVGGWFDHNIKQDLQIMEMLSTSSDITVRDKHQILVGPWVHGGTGQASLGTSFQGDLSFPNAEKWNDSLSIMFFDFYLREISNGWNTRTKYTYYNMGEQSWKHTSAWPPETKDFVYYLSDGEGLYPNQRTNKNFSYQYNPSDPSPTVGGKNLSDNLDQGPYDQSITVETKNDVILFTTETLTEDMSVKGKIEINLHVSSDKKDTDFAVRLTEVYPSGESILLLDGIQRMRFRQGYSLDDTSFMQNGIVYPITIVLDDISNTFLKGNKIRLIISSSNYPRYNRNMNTGEAMYPNNNPDTLVNPQLANNTIYTGVSYPSKITLPVDTAVSSFITNSKSVNSTISLFPNPSNGLFTILGAPAHAVFQVFDIDGKLLIQSNSPRIKLENPKPGIYFIKIQAKNTLITKKIILQ